MSERRTASTARQMTPELREFARSGEVVQHPTAKSILNETPEADSPRPIDESFRLQKPDSGKLEEGEASAKQDTKPRVKRPKRIKSKAPEAETKQSREPELTLSLDQREWKQYSARLTRPTLERFKRLCLERELKAIHPYRQQELLEEAVGDLLSKYAAR